jgi:hypothetical protein
MLAYQPRSDASILVFPLNEGQIKILNGDFRLDVATTPLPTKVKWPILSRIVEAGLNRFSFCLAMHLF